MADEMIQLTCSANPRASTQSSRGHQWWLRDVHHATRDKRKTLCGRDSTGWILFDDLAPVADAAKDPALCQRCAKALQSS